MDDPFALLVHSKGATRGTASPGRWRLLSPIRGPATLGPKGAETTWTYREDDASRASRVEAARKRPPAFFSVGELRSGPVTDRTAQCIDRIAIAFDQKVGRA